MEFFLPAVLKVLFSLRNQRICSNLIIACRISWIQASPGYEDMYYKPTTCPCTNSHWPVPAYISYIRAPIIRNTLTQTSRITRVNSLSNWSVTSPVSNTSTPTKQKPGRFKIEFRMWQETNCGTNPTGQHLRNTCCLTTNEESGIWDKEW